MQRFAAYDEVAEVLSRGTTRASVVLKSGLQVDLRVVPADSYGAALHYFTGSKAHNIAIRRLAQERGLKINEYGVFRGSERIAGEDRGIGLRRGRAALYPAGTARGSRRNRGGARRPAAASWSSWPTCAATCTRTPRPPTATTACARWRWRPRRAGSTTWPSPSTRAACTVAHGLDPLRLARQMRRNRPAQRRARRHHAAQGHRGGHSRRRQPRSAGRGAGAGSTS